MKETKEKKEKFNIHQFYDKTYNKLFSHKRIAEDFIRGFLKEDFAKKIELVEKLNTKFVTKTYKKFESDLIWRAKFNDKDIYIFLLFEFQTQNDDYISLRVLNYVTLFYLDLLKQENIELPLPPVVPIVIHIGNDKFTTNLNFRDLINIPSKSIGKYIPNFKFFLLDLAVFDKAFLKKLAVHTRNLTSLLFEMDKFNYDELLKEFNHIIEIIKANAPKELLKDFQEYLVSVIGSCRFFVDI